MLANSMVDRVHQFVRLMYLCADLKWVDFYCFIVNVFQICGAQTASKQLLKFCGNGEG